MGGHQHCERLESGEPHGGIGIAEQMVEPLEVADLGKVESEQACRVGAHSSVRIGEVVGR
jgi:hypothetical protein